METFTDFIASASGSFVMAVAFIVVLNLIWMGVPDSSQGSANPYSGARSNSNWPQVLLMRMAVTSVLSMLIMSLLATHLRRLRRARAKIVLNHLASAVKMRFPISNYLEVVAQNEHRTIRSRLLYLAGLLEDGLPVGTAFYSANPELDLRIPSMLDAGERTGQLDAVLQELNQRSLRQDDSTTSTVTISHLVITVTFMSLVMGMVFIFVFPKFNEIFRDFGVASPSIMRFFGSNVETLLILFAAVLAIVLLVVLANIARRIVSSKQEIYWYASILDRIKWYLPVLRGLYRQQGYADFLRISSGALEAGYTTLQAISVTNRMDVNVVLRKKIGYLISLIASGVPIEEAAAKAQFPKLIVAMFKSPDRSQLASGLKFAARTYEARYNHLLVAFQSAIPIVSTLVLAVLVGLVATSIFIPITDMIEAVCRKIKIGI